MHRRTRGIQIQRTVWPVASGLKGNICDGHLVKRESGPPGCLARAPALGLALAKIQLNYSCLRQFNELLTTVL